MKNRVQYVLYITKMYGLKDLIIYLVIISKYLSQFKF